MCKSMHQSISFLDQTVDTAYAIERLTGNIFEMPFIGMPTEEAIF
jgi:hypothetical protein